MVVYEKFKAEILSDLRKVKKLDGVLLNLHGAMVAEGYDDVEGDLIQAVREIVGSNIPIGVELDLHCHLSNTMVENADLLISYKEFPHTDIVERAIELFRLMADLIIGEINPCISVYDCRMVGLFPTTTEPLKTFVQKIRSIEGKQDVLSISVGYGYPWGDVPYAGTKLWVITDGRPAEGAILAKLLGEELFSIRKNLIPSYLRIKEGLKKALSVDVTPIVVADVSDNTGAGAPGDSTFVLQAMLEWRIENSVLAYVYDPIAVKLAMTAGEGAIINLRIGGKMGISSGCPVDLKTKVLKIKRNVSQKMGEMESPIGDVAVIGAKGLEIVLITERAQPLSATLLQSLGVRLRQKKLIVLKSAHHFYDSFGKLAKEVVYVAGPGAVVPNYRNIKYKHMDSNKWPIVENPFI
jgi:microcystin degradation protein MlrC